MGKVISLTNWQEKHRAKYVEGTSIKSKHCTCPLFEGIVISVTANIVFANRTFSDLSYFPTSGLNQDISSLFAEKSDDEIENIFSGEAQMARVPFMVIPDTVCNANVKGYIARLRQGMPAYILEVLSSHDIYGNELEHHGFRYIVPLEL